MQLGNTPRICVVLSGGRCDCVQRREYLFVNKCCLHSSYTDRSNQRYLEEMTSGAKEVCKFGIDYPVDSELGRNEQSFLRYLHRSFYKYICMYTTF